MKKLTSLVLISTSLLVSGMFIVGGDEADIVRNKVYVTKIGSGDVVALRVDDDGDLHFFLGEDENTARILITSRDGALVSYFWDRSQNGSEKELGFRIESGKFKTFSFIENDGDTITHLLDRNGDFLPETRAQMKQEAGNSSSFLIEEVTFDFAPKKKSKE